MEETQLIPDENETGELGGFAKQVTGEQVRFENGFAIQVTGNQEVTMQGAGALGVAAGQDMNITDSAAIGIAVGRDLTTTDTGMVAAMVGHDLEMAESGVAVARANQITAQQSFLGVVLARQVNLGEGSQVLLNTPQAVALGAAAGAVFALLSWLLKRK